MKRIFSFFKNSGRDVLKSNLIVLFFVFVHALFCLLLHDTKVGDGIFLTILTIMMVYALIWYYDAGLDMFLGLAFLSCFVGFYLGTEGAGLLERLVPSWGVWTNVITTMVTTEILGLIIILLVRRNSHGRSKGK